MFRLPLIAGLSLAAALAGSHASFEEPTLPSASATPVPRSPQFLKPPSQRGLPSLPIPLLKFPANKPLGGSGEAPRRTPRPPLRPLPPPPATPPPPKAKPAPPPPPEPSLFELEPPPDPLAGVSRPPSTARQFEYALGIRGQKSFSDEQLREAIDDQLTAIRENGLNAASADDTAFFLSAFYRKHGYSQVDVKWTISGHTLLLDISEGPLTTIARVRFFGNNTIPAQKLEEILTGFTKSKKKIAIPYSEAEISAGVARIRGYYLGEGYLDSVIRDADISLSSDKKRAFISLVIEEGTQYRFGDLSVKGEVVFFPRSDLLKELQVFSSLPYTPARLTSLERKVGDYYRSRGYFHAKVRSEADPAKAVNGRVSAVFDVDSGEPYIFGGITQKGTLRLRESFLRNRFKSLTGQPYNPEKVDERYRLLMGTGLFSTLKIRQLPQPNHEVELDFEVVEAKSREIGFSIGYGSLEGAILGTQFVDRNVFGFGRPLSLNAEVAQRLLRGEILFVDPWLLDSAYTMRLRLYALSQDLFDYQKFESGFRGELSRKFGEHLEVTGFLLTRVLNIRSSQIDPVELGKTSYFANSLGFSMTLDYRDSVLNPSQGFIATASGDFATSALGSTVNFFRSTGRISYYHPIGNTLLAVGLRGGFVLPLDSSIPIDERFFNGGSRTVRSYVERSLGPKDRHGNSIGGESFAVLNVEDIFPIAGNLKGAVFFDAGTVGRFIGSGPYESGLAVGLGLRYALPVGPLRIDYGFNPLRREKDPVGAWHFSFGFAF